jgi:hypothetical protein
MACTRKLAALAAGLAATAVLVAAQSASAAAPAIGMDMSTVRTAGVEYDSFSGCVQTHVEVFAQQVLTDTNVSRDPGSPIDVQHSAGPIGFAHVQQWACDGTLVLDAFGPPCCGTSLEGVTIAHDLTSAQLATTIHAQDSVSNSPVDLAVDLRWTAIPPLTRGHVAPSDTHLINHDSGSVENLIFNRVGTGYGASVSGSVSDGVHSYAPDRIDNAFISKDVSKFLHIGGTA